MFFKWGCRCGFKVHQIEDEKSLKLKTKEGKDVRYSKFIREKIGVDEHTTLWLKPWLFNGTLQTLYYARADTSDSFPVYYGREIFEYEDGGICSLDHVIEEPKSKEDFEKLYKETLPEGWPRLHPRTRFFSEAELKKVKAYGQEEDNDRSICFVLHGLAGGSNESLIRNLAELLHKSSDNSKAWDVVVINSRGCCRTKLTSGKLFSAFSTSDIADVITEFRKRYPNRHFYGVGFSFGAALLANYLGEIGAASPFKAACLVSCPWDMVDSSHHIDGSWSGSLLFSPALTAFLNKIVKNNIKELEEHDPETFNQEKLKESLKFKALRQFDALFTCPSIGLSNPFEYYRKASPVNIISDIKTPILALNSTDDPTVSCRLPVQEFSSNPCTCLIESNLGGHLAYVRPDGEFWSAELAQAYLSSFDSYFK